LPRVSKKGGKGLRVCKAKRSLSSNPVLVKAKVSLLRWLVESRRGEKKWEKEDPGKILLRVRSHRGGKGKVGGRNPVKATLKSVAERVTAREEKKKRKLGLGRERNPDAKGPSGKIKPWHIRKKQGRHEKKMAGR